MNETLELSCQDEVDEQQRDPEREPEGSTRLDELATLPLVGDPGAALESGSSIIIVVATDAPLLPHQMKRISKRAALGLARTGSVAHNGSGDIFIAFSTADSSLGEIDRVLSHRSIPNDEIDPLFTATVEAAEEAIVNAMVAAEDMTGNRGFTTEALPHDALKEIMKRYGR